MGPVFMDLEGIELTSEECELLQHPKISGVILFSRNFEDYSQLHHLCHTIHKVAKKHLLISVDQEGGRVQRFKYPFTELASFRQIGQTYLQSPERGIDFAYLTGYIMAKELLTIPIDFSFTPVLDLDRGFNKVIGDRSFSLNPKVVTVLAKALCQGAKTAGMCSVAKHFPGHGYVSPDTHVEKAMDDRTLNQIARSDLLPFIDLIQEGIEAIMPAHITFSQVDTNTACFSSVWLKTILRDALGFQGVVISDDLNMHGASTESSPVSRAIRALEAGCHIIMCCNNRKALCNIIEQLPAHFKLSAGHFEKLKSKTRYEWTTLMQSQDWQQKLKLYMNYRKTNANYSTSDCFG